MRKSPTQAADREIQMTTFGRILFLLIALLILGLVGNGDFEDAQAEHQLYCNYVFGEYPVWPDYKNIGREACDVE